MSHKTLKKLVILSIILILPVIFFWAQGASPQDHRECCGSCDVTHDRGPVGPGGMGEAGATPGTTTPRAPTTPGMPIAEVDRNIARLQNEQKALEPEYKAKKEENRILTDKYVEVWKDYNNDQIALEDTISRNNDISKELEKVNDAIYKYTTDKISLSKTQTGDLKERRERLEQEFATNKQNIDSIVSTLESKEKKSDAAKSKANDYFLNEYSPVADKADDIKNNIAGWQAAKDYMQRSVKDFR